MSVLRSEPKNAATLARDKRKRDTRNGKTHLPAAYVMHAEDVLTPGFSADSDRIEFACGFSSGTSSFAFGIGQPKSTALRLQSDLQ